jgi:DNA polymerase III subunit epsilon
MFPGKRNSLDALCDRFGISNAHRTLHGALLDSELLAEVYLAMTRGQESLVIDMIGETAAGEAGGAKRVKLDTLELVVLAASADELAEHEALLDGIDKSLKGTSVWRTQAAAEDASATVDAQIA